MEDLVNNFESNDDLEDVEDAPIDPLQIKKEDYEISKIIKYLSKMFHDYEIRKKQSIYG